MDDGRPDLMSTIRTFPSQRNTMSNSPEAQPSDGKVAGVGEHVILKPRSSTLAGLVPCDGLAS